MLQRQMPKSVPPALLDMGPQRPTRTESCREYRARRHASRSALAPARSSCRQLARGSIAVAQERAGVVTTLEGRVTVARASLS